MRTRYPAIYRQTGAIRLVLGDLALFAVAEALVPTPDCTILGRIGFARCLGMQQWEQVEPSKDGGGSASRGHLAMLPEAQVASTLDPCI